MFGRSLQVKEEEVSGVRAAHDLWLLFHPLSSRNETGKRAEEDVRERIVV